jgi:hypothetical protein
MRRRIAINSALIVIAFLVAFYGKNILNTYISITIPTAFLKVSYSYLWWIFPTILVLGILYGFKDLFINLGMNKGLAIGFLFSAITALPMIVSSAIIGKIDDNLEFGTLLHKTFGAGIFEEYLFRGFLFGILFRKLNWGFIPASIIGGLIFGLGHIYQGSTPLETLGVFAITSIGAVWFSWLYIEWNNNLWIPIFLHALMNLSWILFEVSSNALGGLYTNLFRIITIALTIIITIRYHRERGLKINRKNLILNNNS